MRSTNRAGCKRRERRLAYEKDRGTISSGDDVCSDASVEASGNSRLSSYEVLT